MMANEETGVMANLEHKNFRCGKCWCEIHGTEQQCPRCHEPFIKNITKKELWEENKRLREAIKRLRELLSKHEKISPGIGMRADGVFGSEGSGK